MLCEGQGGGSEPCVRHRERGDTPLDIAPSTWRTLPIWQELLTQQELQLLLRTPRARAITCVKWVAARLAHLEALGYMAPLQLHETNEGLQVRYIRYTRDMRYPRPNAGLQVSYIRYIR